MIELRNSLPMENATVEEIYEYTLNRGIFRETGDPGECATAYARTVVQIYAQWHKQGGNLEEIAQSYHYTFAQELSNAQDKLKINQRQLDAIGNIPGDPRPKELARNIAKISDTIQALYGAVYATNDITEIVEFPAIFSRTSPVT